MPDRSEDLTRALFDNSLAMANTLFAIYQDLLDRVDTLSRITGTLAANHQALQDYATNQPVGNVITTDLNAKVLLMSDQIRVLQRHELANRDRHGELNQTCADRADEVFAAIDTVRVDLHDLQEAHESLRQDHNNLVLASCDMLKRVEAIDLDLASGETDMAIQAATHPLEDQIADLRQQLGELQILHPEAFYPPTDEPATDRPCDFDPATCN
jgi:hypothetical protein